MVGVIIASMVGMSIQEEAKGIGETHLPLFVAFHLYGKTLFLCPVYRLFWPPDRYHSWGSIRSIGRGFQER